MGLVRDIFIVCGSLSIALGLIYLFVTYRLNFEKKYLYFGLFSVFAGIYYFIGMRDVESIDNPYFMSES